MDEKKLVKGIGVNPSPPRLKVRIGNVMPSILMIFVHPTKDKLMEKTWRINVCIKISVSGVNLMKHRIYLNYHLCKIVGTVNSIKPYRSV